MENKIFQFDESLSNALSIAIQFASEYEQSFISNEIFVASLFCEPSSPVFQAALANGFNSDEINDTVIDIIMKENIEYSIIPSTFTLIFKEVEILLQYEIYSILEESIEIAKSFRREKIRVEDSIAAIAELYPEIYVDITTALLLASKLTGMDAKAQKYTSPTKYLILVNKSSHTVAIYKGSQDNWKKVRSFLCTVGKPSTPTTSGVFHIGQTKGKYVKARYFDSYPSRCWYPTRIHDGYMFHSVLYKIAPTPGALNNGTLGASLSHGCIRLAINNAKYIHDVIPAGTTTVIY